MDSGEIPRREGNDLGFATFQSMTANQLSQPLSGIGGAREDDAACFSFAFIA